MKTPLFSKRIGILGGLGPFATAEFLNTLFLEAQQLGARRDQDFPNVTVDCVCETPDRTAFLRGSSSVDPAPLLLQGLHRLEQAGCQVIGIPCNTAHAFWEVLAQGKASMQTRMVHCVDETVAWLQKKGVSSCLLLATDGTLHSRLYHRAFQDRGLLLRSPEVGDAIQREVMDLIYGISGIKAGFRSEELTARLQRVVQSFPAVDAVILGCSELPLVAPRQAFPGCFLVDPMQILANALLRDSV